MDAEVAGASAASHAPGASRVTGANGKAVDEDPEPQSRPGDVARAALRRAVAERRAAGASAEDAGVPGDGSARDATESGPDGGAGEGATDLSDNGVGEAAVTEQSGHARGDASAGLSVQEVASAPESDTAADGASTRPADAAREALRAARGAARKAREDVEAGGVASVRRPERRASVGSGGAAGGRGGVRGRTSEAGARDLREFLAGAFQLPADLNSPAEETAPDNDLSAPGSSHSEDFTPTAAPTLDPDLIPATPQTPTSMASPSRDSDLRRTFPAFAPRPSAGSADDGSGDSADEAPRFAETWWGNAWVTALEEGALDPKRLLRGRSYAEKGHVDAITVTPGLVLAYVKGSRARPYRVQVRLRTLADADWERFLDAAADRPGDIAALLDKEMPKSLAECGVPLLPGPGDLAPQCSCPDSGHPCKHAAALCYQTARLLDADPFVLLLLRGRGERPLLDALSRRNAARAARAAQEQEPAPLPGVRATDVLAAQGERRLPPLPLPLPIPPHPEQPPVYPAAPGGPDPFALDQLATDAAARAHALLSTGRDPVGDLTLWQDAVRLAAARPGSGLTVTTRALYASLAKATGRSTAELARAVAAWRQGGIEGLAVLEDPWDPPAGRFDRARPLLLAADLPAFRPWHNHLTHPHGHVQLRLGRDGLWYAYESEPGDEDWWPRGTPDLDPVGALTGLGAPGDV
ncbi:SWIM zinc finger family protein [Streptomyces sp. SAS_260]